MWIYFYLVISCCIYSSMSQLCSQCEQEQSHNTENNVTIIWKSKTNSYMTSLCLHKNNTLIKRKCRNCKWDPIVPPQCEKLQKKFEPKCIKGDQEYYDFCINYQPPDRWSLKLPVSQVESLNDTLRIAYLVKNITEMWLPILRIEKYGKVNRMSTSTEEKSCTYLNPLRNNTQKNTYDLDCIVAKNISVIKNDENKFVVTYVPKTVNCVSNFSVVYVYKKVNRFFVSNNNTKDSPIIYSTKGNKIFYTHTKCKKNAEPRFEEDNFLIKQLVQNKTCKIGIKYLANVSNYVWESTNEIINYTDWILSTEFEDFDNVVISSSGWSLNKSKFIQCYVCEDGRYNYIHTIRETSSKNNSSLMFTAHTFSLRFSCQLNGLKDFNVNFEIIKKIDADKEFDQNYNKIKSVRDRTVWELVSRNKTVEFNYFHCIGTLFLNGIDIKTKLIPIGDVKSPEFAFEIIFKEHCMHHNCDPYLNKNFKKTLPKIFKGESYIRNYRAVQILKIYETSGDIKLLYHAQIENNSNLSNGYEKLNNYLGNLNNRSSNISINLESVKNCQGCLPNITGMDNVSLYWNFTEIGATAFSESCTQSNYLPITRKCVGNYLIGGSWLDVSGKCNNKIRQSVVTKKLESLQTEVKTMTITNVVNKLANFTQKRNIFIPTDITVIAQIFKDIRLNLTETDNTTMIAKDFSMTISNLIATNNTSLKLLSNKNLKATDEILISIDNLMENISKHNLNESGVFQQIEPNFVYQLFNPFVCNITGIVLIRPNTTLKYPAFTDYKTRLLTADDHIKEIIKIENLEAAAYVPKELLNDIRKESVNGSELISMSFFYNDSLFLENNKTNNVLTKIFSISISGYNNKILSSSIPIIFRNFHPEEMSKLKCGFWDFGDMDQFSKWNNDNYSINESEYVKVKNIQICKFDHLTHFALLAGISESLSSKISVDILTYITHIGSILSILGIAAIFATAAMFKFWRKLTGTKIIINVSISILLQLAALYGNIKINNIACIVTGSILHYSVLSGFMWSLVMAYLQYWRLVKVLGNITSHLILKALFIGWIIPLIPVGIVLLINSSEYLPNDMQKHKYNDYLCYPDGIVLYTTVYLPVGIIVLTNFIIFCMIMYEVHTQTQAMSSFRFNFDEKEMMIKEAKLGIFLFFSLSLTWIFGLLAISQYCNFCTYIFVTTASCQGCILFVYYVLFNKDIRLFWIKFIKTNKVVLIGNLETASKIHLTNEENEMDDMKKNVVGNQATTLKKVNSQKMDAIQEKIIEELTEYQDNKKPTHRFANED